MPTFGYTAGGATQQSSASPFTYASRFDSHTAGATDTLDSVHVYCDTASGTQASSSGVYDITTWPANLLTTGSITATTTLQWQVATGLATAMVNSTKYCAAFYNGASTNFRYYYDSGVAADNAYEAGNFNDPWTATTSVSRKYSVYATYLAGAAISTVPSTIARGETGLTITGSEFGATQGSGGVTFGAIAMTITAWSDTSITITCPSSIGLLYAASTHVLVVTANDASFDTSAAIPFTPESGRDYIDLVSPAYAANSHMLFGYTGTPAPVNTDQLEYDTTTPESSIANNPTATSEWILATMPTTTQTTTCQIVRAATKARSSSWTITWYIATLGISGFQEMMRKRKRN